MAGIYGGPTMNYNSGKKMVSNNVNVNKQGNQFANQNAQFNQNRDQAFKKLNDMMHNRVNTKKSGS